MVNEWKQKKLADIAELSMGQSPSSKDCNDSGEGLPFYQGNADFGYIHPNATKYCTKPKKIANKEDILISVRAPVGDLNIANEECVIGRGLSAIKATDMDRDFLFYFLQYYKPMWSNIQQGSTFESINKGDLSDLIVPNPPLGEQRKISKIISSISSAIQKTESIIEQTEKVKKGLMQQLLTKGIGHTKFKKTEIGEIPEEWDVKNLNDLTSLITNGFVGVASPYYSDDENAVPYFMSNNVRANRLDLNKLIKVNPEFSQKQQKSILKQGDMLTVQSGHIGSSSIVPKEYEGANCHALIISKFSDENVSPYFVSYYLNSVIGMNRLKSIFVGSTVPHINVKDFKKFSIPIPTLQEQQKIIDILLSVDQKITKERRNLNQLQILKKGLMQVLLTGKVRVKVDKEEVTTS